MGHPTLDVLLEGDAASGWVARAPAVGIWSGIPVAGVTLDAGRAGVLTQAGRRFLLRLPVDTGGVLTAVGAEGHRAIDVEWGQELFRIAPLGDAPTTDAASDSRGPAPDVLVNVLVAPTDGVFYARPTPDAAAFVSPGDTLTLGQAVGLIEVMKTFNHVLFAGAGLPATAVVEALLVADGEEVTAGAPILRYEPLG